MRYGFDGCLFELVLSFGWKGILSDIDHSSVSRSFWKVKKGTFHSVVAKRFDFEFIPICVNYGLYIAIANVWT